MRKYEYKQLELMRNPTGVYVFNDHGQDGSKCSNKTIDQILTEHGQEGWVLRNFFKTKVSKTSKAKTTTNFYYTYIFGRSYETD